MNKKKCRCECHIYCGVYKNDPCSVCGHNNEDGDFIGGIIDGYWILKDEEGNTTET
jgi:hypothetical protein